MSAETSTSSAAATGEGGDSSPSDYRCKHRKSVSIVRWWIAQVLTVVVGGPLGGLWVEDMEWGYSAYRKRTILADLSKTQTPVSDDPQRVAMEENEWCRC